MIIALGIGEKIDFEDTNKLLFKRCTTQLKENLINEVVSPSKKKKNSLKSI